MDPLVIDENNFDETNRYIKKEMIHSIGTYLYGTGTNQKAIDIMIGSLRYNMISTSGCSDTVDHL